MQARYERNIPSLTEAESELLRTKKVAVIGCGGLGGYIIEQLARLGIGTIRIVDGDVFEESNLNRQLFSDVTVLGKPKTEVSQARIAAVNPDVQVEALYGYLEEDNAAFFKQMGMALGDTDVKGQTAVAIYLCHDAEAQGRMAEIQRRNSNLNCSHEIADMIISMAKAQNT